MIRFVVGALIAWRLTTMLHYEAGPFSVFERLRALAVRTGAGSLVACFHCLGLWVSAVVVLADMGARPAAVAWILALSGAVSLTERALGVRAAPTENEGHDAQV